MLDSLTSEMCNIAVYEGDASQTCRQQPLAVTSPSGYLASVVTSETKKGSQPCPWSVTVAPGQVVNLTLVDLGVSAQSTPNYGSCLLYAKIWSGGVSTATEPLLTICGGSRRERFLYSSSGRIDLRVVVYQPASHDPVHFLIGYDGTLLFLKSILFVKRQVQVKTTKRTACKTHPNNTIEKKNNSLACQHFMSHR
jgi:hypothetical protein